MKYLTNCALIALFSLLFSALSYAQPRDQSSFVITKGEVTVTPARCFPKSCEVTTAELLGSFVAFLPGGGSQLFFTSSSVSTNPDVDFSLPAEPDNDSNGIVRDVKFTFDEQGLYVEGLIDSRAFDGPLIEYSLLAQPQENTDFNPKGFFTARPDFRKCVSPLCGGYFVKRVNGRVTRCADGTRKRECYVAELNFPGSLNNDVSGFNNKTPLLVQGEILPKKYDPFGNLGVFNAKSAYVSATNNSARGYFLGLENNGIVCITSPCFSYDAYVLNRRRVVEVSSFNLDKVGASKDKVERAQKILANGGVLPVAGYIRRVSLPFGKGKEVVAKQFFLPLIANISACEKGYSFSDGACRTPYGCVFPDLELTGTGGAAMIDPITGELVANTTKSCTDSCEFPAVLQSAGQCAIFYP